MKAKLKFDIITHFKERSDQYKTKTAVECISDIAYHFNTTLNLGTFQQWAREYDLGYKKASPKSKQNQVIEKQGQQIRALAMIIANLCKELDMSVPDQLSKLRESLEE